MGGIIPYKMDTIESPVKVGVVGVGNIGPKHCWTVDGLTGAKLTAVVDINYFNAKSVAQAYGVPYFVHFNDPGFLELVDAVLIATPPNRHLEPALAAIDAGKHVFVEKPLAGNHQDAREIYHAAFDYQRWLNLIGEGDPPRVYQVGYRDPFNPTFIDLKNLLESQIILNVEIERTRPPEPDRNVTNTDVVTDLMTHDFYLLYLLAQKGIEICGADEEIIDSRTVHTRALFRNKHSKYAMIPNTRFDLLASTNASIKSTVVRVLTDQALYIADLRNGIIIVERKGAADQIIITEQCNTLKAEWEYFINCIKIGVKSEVSFYDALFCTWVREIVKERVEYDRPKKGSRWYKPEGSTNASQLSHHINSN